MKKLIKNKQVFYTCKRVNIYSKNEYKWSEVKEELAKAKIELQDTDSLYIRYEDGWDEGDSARDPVYSISVYRDVEETDEEYNRRIEYNKKSAEELKKRRYEQYLKLKEEFENPKKIKEVCDHYCLHKSQGLGKPMICSNCGEEL